jgi:hypothetical protein
MIGAVTGLVLGTTFEGTESGETGRGAAGLLGGVFLGAGVGALADALRRGWTPVYRAPTKMPLSIVPMVGGGQFGVAVTVPIVRR